MFRDLSRAPRNAFILFMLAIVVGALAYLQFGDFPAPTQQIVRTIPNVSLRL